MALNCAMINSTRDPVPLPSEQFILTVDSGAEIILHIPDAPPEGSASAGGSGGSQKLKAMGRVWITDSRVSVTHFITPHQLQLSYSSSLHPPQTPHSTR